MAIKGGKPYLAYTPLSHYIFCPVVKVVSTQFPPCVPAEIALISTLTRQVCTYQRLTYLLTLSTYRCADLTHADRTPSMKLNEDYFYCFGCGATGDVIDLVAKLFNLSSYDAAKKLAYDFGIDPDKPPAAAALRKPKYPLAKAFQNETLHCQRILCDYLHLLEHWKVQYAPKTPEDTLDDHFVEACQMLDYIEDLTDILTFAELEVRVKTVDMLQKDGMIDRLEERLKRTAKEVDARDETEIG